MDLHLSLKARAWVGRFLSESTTLLSGISGIKDRVFYASLALLSISVIGPADANATIVGRFSLGVGEEYTDNLFFEKKKEHDFATVISPTFSILYAPPGQTTPIFSADFTPQGQIFARHSGESNFGKNTTLNLEYTHYYSPRLTFYVRDTFESVGPTRSTSSGFERTSTLPPPGGGTGGPPVLGRTGDFGSFGNEVRNLISTRGTYTYSPNVSFTGDYAFGSANYIDAGGSDVWHHVGARGVYRWRDEHNLHFGYGVDIIKTRDGDNSVVHDIDIGDDFFSAFKLKLDPTLTILASTGIGIVTGSGGVTVANRFSLDVTKLWETATLNLGVHKGITPSLGVAGVSDTTSFFTNFTIRFTELLSAYMRTDFSLYDTDDGSFKTFTGGTGLRYRILSWLSSELRYAHRWEIDAGSATTSTSFVGRGRISSNSVALNFTANFDVWPTLGFARAAALP